MSKIGNGSIPLRIGRLIDATVYGGPYKKVPQYFWGVKMAEEINHPHMVSVPTKDYCVPKVSDLKAGIVKALMAMINEEDVYVGCMGGIGRTGIFLAALAKVQIEYRKTKHRAGRGDDPVLYVRKHFIPHAVETAEQEKYIADLDVSDIVNWLTMTQVAMGLGGLTPAKTVVGHQHTAGIVETTFTGRILKDPPLQNIKPGWISEADKLYNPAFDHYQEQWKSTRDSRNIDWMDAPEADSATVVPLDQHNRMDDMQAQIDEITERHECALVRIEAANQRIDNFLRAVSDLNKRLTNATWSGKIRRLFK